MQGKRFEESMKSLVVVARAQKAGQLDGPAFSIAWKSCRPCEGLCKERLIPQTDVMQCSHAIDFLAKATERLNFA
jgi:hypothetical protein